VVGIRVRFCWDDRFGAAHQFAAGEQDAPPTAEAFQPDVRAEARNLPFNGTTRVRLPHTDGIFQLQVGEHEKIIPARNCL
jgi:hypothetical protein